MCLMYKNQPKFQAPEYMLWFFKSRPAKIKSDPIKTYFKHSNQKNLKKNLKKFFLHMEKEFVCALNFFFSLKKFQENVLIYHFRILVEIFFIFFFKERIRLKQRSLCKKNLNFFKSSVTKNVFVYFIFSFFELISKIIFLDKNGKIFLYSGFLIYSRA